MNTFQRIGLGIAALFVIVVSAFIIASAATSTNDQAGATGSPEVLALFDQEFAGVRVYDELPELRCWYSHTLDGTGFAVDPNADGLSVATALPVRRVSDVTVGGGSGRKVTGYLPQPDSVIVVYSGSYGTAQMYATLRPAEAGWEVVTTESCITPFLDEYTTIPALDCGPNESVFLDDETSYIAPRSYSPAAAFEVLESDQLKFNGGIRSGDTATAVLVSNRGAVRMTAEAELVDERWTLFSTTRCDDSDSPGTTVSTTTAAPTTTTTTIRSGRPVPDVTGITVDDAILTIFDWGLRIERVDEPNDEIPRGFVVRTNPAPGTVVSPQSVVTIVVSSG